MPIDAALNSIGCRREAPDEIISEPGEVRVPFIGACITRTEQTGQASASDAPSHQLINVAATNDEGTLKHLAQYVAGFLCALGVLQRMQTRLENV